MGYEKLLYIVFPLFSFLLNLVITPFLIYYADKYGFHDFPEERKIHLSPVSNLGGIGFFLSIIITLIIYSIFIEVKLIYMVTLCGFFLIHMTGVIDDRYDIRAGLKLLLQIAAALFIVISGIVIDSINIPFIGVFLKLEFFAIPITVIWIISVANAVNLIDGLDGQAGGISFITFISITVVHYLTGSFVPAVISSVFAASVGGFLLFNKPPAKIFMGDGGSLLLGFAIAVLPLLGNGGSLAQLLGPLTVIMIPVLDVIASIVRRKRKGVPFFYPDKEHTHHKLLDFGFSNNQILYLVYSFSSLFAVISIYWCMEMNFLSLSLILSAWITGISIFLILDKKYKSKIRSKRRAENIRLISLFV